VSGRVVLVTGASSGLGYEMALALVQQGDKVVATARRIDRLEQLAQTAQGLSGELLTLAADVTKAEDMQHVVDQTVNKWGRLDVLIANAGIGQRGPIVEANWDDLDVVIRTNVDGVLHSVRAAVPAIRKAGGGQIILISSVTALAMTPYATIYAASKSMVMAIGRGLRVELRKDPIWVTTILLGQTHTEFAASRKGQPGKVAGKLPTMTAAWAAERIIRQIGRKNTIVTLRWLDRLINAVGVYLPRLMDRIMERIYVRKS
jgi:short-subunit dehydrogenase